MSENKNNKKIENRGENLVDITNEYNKNGRPQDESESVLDEAVDKVKQEQRKSATRLWQEQKQSATRLRILTKTLVPNITKKKQNNRKINDNKRIQLRFNEFFGIMSFLLLDF